ncbi:hypothetical protein QR680_004856 [Steinernema hermaphroditum]|uniref:Cystatin domain-containing protein n=1 Tax=Steinernema hermaphroditum TaxID=289476 RepID=A0AA39HS98_9BILA|nr:hypothetical protein QR680_004856 [Steinernema hermaphroditum]
MAKLIVAFVALCLTVGPALAPPGGFVNMKLDDPRIEDLKWKTIKAINAGQNAPFNGSNHFVPLRVKNVRMQVVAGFNYLVDLDVVESTCHKLDVLHEELRTEVCKPKDLKWKVTEKINADSKRANLMVPSDIRKITVNNVYLDTDSSVPVEHLYRIQLDAFESICLKSKVTHAQLKASPSACKKKVGGGRNVFAVNVHESTQGSNIVIKGAIHGS